MRIGAYFGATNPQVGGGFTFQDEVLKALVRQAVNAPQHDFFVIGTSSSLHDYLGSLELPKNLSFLLSKSPNIFQRVCEWLKKGLLILTRILKVPGPLEKLAKKNKLDLIWFIGGGSFEVLDTPYIATVWDLQHRLQPWFPEVSANGEWAARETQYHYFLSRASFVIVGTEAGREEVELFYRVPKFRIYKLPHPTPSFALNQSQDVADVCKKYNLPQNYIFYPAQFWSHKNHINLLQAIKIVNEKYGVKLPLVLVGADKGNLDYVKQSAYDLGLQTQLFVLGFVPQADLYDLYKNASMLAYISLCGPENLPPLEAFAIGCPVVASEVCGSKEQFGEAVLFCDPKNPQDIADQIYRVLHDENLKEELINNGRIRASSWTADDFVIGVFKMAEDFSAIRKNWSN
ncbi:MAG TPA: glycosyltransferase family 1 protein [Methylotenera sp.]|nr:glycosyltransferase family 1 protein [Methylotenera sp.]